MTHNPAPETLDRPVAAGIPSAGPDRPAPRGVGRPATVPARIPFGFLEELMDRNERPGEPLTVHIELRFAGTLDEAALRRAIGAALSAHPMARARKAEGRLLLRLPRWEITEPSTEGVLRRVDCRDERELDALRDELYSRPIALDRAPALQFVLARREGGDSLLFAAHHALTDGVGGMRFLHSVAHAYAGRPEPPAAADPIAARDLRAQRGRLPARPAGDAVPPPARGAALAFAAPDGADGSAGYGLRLRAIASDRRTLDPRRYGPSATLNDLLLAALHLNIADWNATHGRPAGRISAFIPFSLRPPEWYRDVVANLTLGGKVASLPDQRADPRALMAAVIEQTASIKGGGGLAAILATPPWIMRHLPVVLSGICRLLGDRAENSAVLTYFGRLDREVPDFGPEAGEVVEVWGSPPVGMPAGLAVGAAQLRGRLLLALRYRRALFDAGAADRFLDRLVENLGRLADAPASAAGPDEAETPAGRRPLAV